MLRSPSPVLTCSWRTRCARDGFSCRSVVTACSRCGPGSTGRAVARRTCHGASSVRRSASADAHRWWRWRRRLRHSVPTARAPDRPGSRRPHQGSRHRVCAVWRSSRWRSECGAACAAARSAAVAGPRRRSHHHAMHRAGHPRRVGLQHGLDEPEVQGPPAPPALALVVALAALAALPTTTTLARVRPHMSHHQLLDFVVLDPLDAGLLNSEQPTIIWRCARRSPAILRFRTRHSKP